MRAPARAGHRRRRFPHAVFLAAVLSAALLAPPASAEPGARFDDAAYWAYADRLQTRLDPMWDERAGRYRSAGGGTDSMINSLLLLTHSAAALAGHEGSARNDHRARLVARALVSAPAFVTRTPRNPTAGSQPHAPGWSNSMGTAGVQHLVFDAEIVDGLTFAWRARRQLELPQSTVNAIARAIDTTARGRYWRWPTIRLNQVNWYALMYAADATVTGRTDLVRRDMRNQLIRFVRGVRAHAGTAGNLGPGMRFHYLPGRPASHPMNVDSAEYANIVLSFSRFYVQARRAGMKPLPRAHVAVLRRWVTRALAGYWTHAGYMNWDSGLGFDRWHQAKKLGLTQQALIGIAQARPLQPSPAYGRWAKHMLDRGLAWYAALPTLAGPHPDPVFFKVRVVPQGFASAQLGAARMQANAARAADAGLGRMASSAPPPLYAFDPDIGRLAVTTPAYNTAIVAVNQRAFPYGGIELARLYDGDQNVAANIGGRAPASFGVSVRGASGRRVFASQTGRRSVDRRVTPLRLTRAPSGITARASTTSRQAFAGAFSDLRAVGSITSPTVRVTTAHRFRARAIETYWSVARRRGSAQLRAEVLFPSWGRGARVVAVLRDGSRVSLRAHAVRLERIAWLHVVSERSGYVVVPLRRPGGAVARATQPARQSSAPDPGPTAVIEIARGVRWRRPGFAVRLAPAHEDEAADVAARLGAGR
jgi:hypothetical protein